MRGYKIVTCLHVGCREHRAHLAQRHVEIAKSPNDLRDLNLLRGIAAIARLRIDLRGFEKPRLMIVTQGLRR